MIPISERKRIVVKVGTSTLTRSAKCRARGDLGVQRCDWSWYG